LKPADSSLEVGTIMQVRTAWSRSRGEGGCCQMMFAIAPRQLNTVARDSRIWSQKRLAEKCG